MIDVEGWNILVQYKVLFHLSEILCKGDWTDIQQYGILLICICYGELDSNHCHISVLRNSATTWPVVKAHSAVVTCLPIWPLVGHFAGPNLDNSTKTFAIDFNRRSADYFKGLASYVFTHMKRLLKL